MSEERLGRLIEDFSYRNLNLFFRDKCENYAETQENVSQYDDERFSDFQRLGEIRFDDGDKLVAITSQVSRDLSERSGKKAQYEKAKKILKELAVYDAGFFIFHDNAGSFRFSLVYGQAEGTRKSWSNFRRFTYFVSRDQTNKTFLDRVGRCTFSSLEAIRDAFSVEKVTKAFYKEIADWYFWAAKNVTFPEDAEKETTGRKIAVIRMITRLIFIWFMKERRLVSLNLFNKEKISTLLKSLQSNETTYYKAILQNLFFATLNTKIENRKFRFDQSYQGKNKDYMNHNIYRYENYFKNQEDMLVIFKDIPFLNGGLFDCLDQRVNENGQNIEARVDGFTDKEVGLSVPNLLFFSDEVYANLNEDYGTKNKKYKVQGLLNILSAYNFTIDENDPNDQEVALDPELLGKVFENLLASFNPETATTARKATGSYYTPREIVDYMVTQSLEQYYKTHLHDVADIDNKLEKLFSTATDEQRNPFGEADTRRVVELTDNLRIVDPAVGSGAFPMGILNKLVLVLAKVDPDNKLWQETQIKVVEGVPDPVIKKKLKAQITTQFAEKNSDYGRKLYLIQKCIYGVDIQQIAIEIAKLRFFIALLVDERIDKSKPNWGIEPLPNLEFKLMQGNSLISEFMSINLDTEDSNSYGKLIKDEMDELITQFQDKKSQYQCEPDRNKKEGLKNEIEKLITEIFEGKLQKQKSEYFNKLKAIETKYSTLPNIQQRNESISQDKETLYKNYGFNLGLFEKQLREFTSGLKVKPFFAWKLYFAEVFHEKGGFDIVIANPPYNAKLTKEERRLYKHNFESVSSGRQDTAAMFVELAKRIASKEMLFAYILPYRLFSRKRNHGQFQIYTLNNFSILKILYLGSNIGFSSSDEFMILTMAANRDINNRVKIALSPDIGKLNNEINFIEIEQAKFIEKGAVDINLVRYNRTILSKLEQSARPLGSVCHVKDGIIVHIRDKLVSKKREDNRYVKFAGIAGKYVLQKYFFNYDESYLCYDLNEAKKYITDKSELRKVQFRERGIFLERKILTAQNSIKLKGTIDESKTFVSNSLHSTYLKEEFRNIFSLEYILALINSQLLNYYHDSLRLKGTDLHPQILISNLKKLPIKNIPLESQKPFILLVDKILALTKDEDYLASAAKQAKVKELEREIDQMAYDLYGLTPEEKAVVEGNSSE